MTVRGFARGRSAAQSSFESISPDAHKIRALLLRTASLFAIAASASAIGGGALAAGLTIGPGATHNVVGTETFDFLSIAPTGTLNFGAAITNDVFVNDNGVDTTWSGLINSTAPLADKDDQYLVKNGNGTVTIQDLTTNGTEVHISNGTIKQTSGTSTIFILNVGSNVPAAGTATFNISGGTFNIPGGAASPFPAMQVGHFGGTGFVNQSGGIVNIGDAASLNIGNQGGTGTYSISGGTLDFQGGGFSVGRSTNTRPTNSSGTLNISGTALADVHGSSFLILGNRESSTTNNTTATLNQSGGTLRIRNGGILYLSGKNSATTYNFTGGTLEIGGTDLQPVYLPSGGGGTYAFNLGGGTIKVIGSTLNTAVNANLLAGSTSTFDTNAFGAAWTGTLSGPGNLTKAGPGTLTFSTVQPYTGVTNISGGTLLLAAGGSIAASAGVNLSGAGARFDIVSGSKQIKDLSGIAGTFVDLGGSILTAGTTNNTTFAGSIQGPGGGLTKVGTGMLTLAGINTYSGPTNVNVGTLRIGPGGSITSTSSLVIANNAAFDLGGSGAQTVAGNVAFGGAGATYLLTLGSHDTLTTTAGGTATLGSAAVAVRAGSGTFDPSTDYVILTANGVAGTFGSISDDMPFLNAQLRAPTATQQAIFFTKGGTLGGAGTTPNQTAVGGALDALPIGNPLFNSIATLGTADALKLLDQLSGDFHASTHSFLVQSGLYLAGAAGDRLDTLGGSGGGAPLAYADDKGPGAPWPGLDGRKNGPDMWAQGYGQLINLGDGSGNAGSVNGNQVGILGGIDGGSDAFLAGVGGGYSAGAFNASSRNAKGTVEGVHALAYAGGELGMVQISGGGTYSWSSIGTTRTISLPTAQTLTASYQARTAQVFGEIGADTGIFEPFAGANYINVASGAFTETGGSAALTAAANTTSVTFTTLGVRAETEMAGQATLRAMAGWRHAFGDVVPLSTLAIQGQSYTVAGVPVARDAFVAEAGVEVDVSKTMTIGASYSGQIGADAQDHGAKGTATVKF